MQAPEVARSHENPCHKVSAIAVNPPSLTDDLNGVMADTIALCFYPEDSWALCGRPVWKRC